LGKKKESEGVRAAVQGQSLKHPRAKTWRDGGFETVPKKGPKKLGKEKTSMEWGQSALEGGQKENAAKGGLAAIRGRF